MTDTAGPFDGTPWSEGQWARHAAVWAPSSVYGTPATSTTTGDLPLSVTGLSVGLGAGRAWVRGFGFERTGTAVMQTVTANTHASFSRRDRIVLRRNLATHTITPVLITGTPAGTPVAPAITQSETGSWDLPLFSFLVPPSSGTTLSGLVDERVFLNPDIGGADTGWVNFDTTSPVTGGATGNQYRVLDGMATVSLDAAYNGTWSGTFVMVTLPLSARPSRRLYFAATWYGDAPAYVRIDTNGDITVANATGTHTGIVGTFVYPVG